MSKTFVKLNNNFLSVPIAHRGCHNNKIAENSLEAFKIAKNRKIAIEIDVYRLKDGEFAVFHDENLKRVTGENVFISSLTSDNLKNYNLFDNQKIPLLSDVLNIINGEVPLLIELKPEGNFNKNDLPALLEIIDVKYSIFSFNSFSSFSNFVTSSLVSLANLKSKIAFA